MSLFNNFAGTASQERVWSSRSYVDLVNNHTIAGGDAAAADSLQTEKPFYAANVGTDNARGLRLEIQNGTSSFTELDSKQTLDYANRLGA